MKLGTFCVLCAQGRSVEVAVSRNCFYPESYGRRNDLFATEIDRWLLLNHSSVCTMQRKIERQMLPTETSTSYPGGVVARLVDMALQIIEAI